MKVFRFAALAWVAAASLCLFSLSSRAQEAEAEVKLVEHTYDLSGLTRSEFMRTPRNGGIGDVLAPDHLFSPQNGYEARPDRWSLRASGDEARCWDDSSEVLGYVATFCNPEGYQIDFSAGNPADGARVKVSTTAEIHRRMEFVIAALREIARARVSVKVFRLDGRGEVGEACLTPAQAIAAQKTARLMGTMHGGLGERMVLQRLQHQSYVADYDVNVATGATSPVSQVRDMRTGEEMVAGAIMLPGGRLWLQAWHAALKLEAMRKVETNCGQVEMPRAGYSYTPLSVVMAKGSGAILDVGALGRFLLMADCNSVIENKKLALENGGSIELLNLAGILQGQGPEANWIMTPNVNRVTADGVPLEQVFLDVPIDGPYNDAGTLAQEWLERQEGFGDGLAFAHLGPVFAVMSRPPTEDEEAIKQHAANLARLRDSIKVIAREAEGTVIRVRAWIVSSSVTLPEGVIDGSPSAKDLGVMASMSAPAFDRATPSMVGQGVDLMDLTLATHLRDYQTQTAEQSTGLDPQIGVQVLGKQVRWISRTTENGKLRIEVRAAVTVGPGHFEQIPLGEDKKWNIERSQSDLAQVDMSGELAIGEGVSTICPGGAEDSLLVMVVERVK